MNRIIVAVVFSLSLFRSLSTYEIDIDVSKGDAERDGIKFVIYPHITLPVVWEEGIGTWKKARDLSDVQSFLIRTNLSSGVIFIPTKFYA
jgi:hypothetical protein